MWSWSFFWTLPNMTYAWLGPNTDLRSTAAFLGATIVWPWILWVVDAKESISGNCWTVATLLAPFDLPEVEYLTIFFFIGVQPGNAFERLGCCLLTSLPLSSLSNLTTRICTLSFVSLRILFTVPNDPLQRPSVTSMLSIIMTLHSILILNVCRNAVVPTVPFFSSILGI